MSCLKANDKFLIKRGEIEIKQVEPSRKKVIEYQNIMSEITAHSDYEKFVLAKDEKEQMQYKEFLKFMQDKTKEANDFLILATIEGNIFEKGYFKIEGQEQKLEDIHETIDEMPVKLYNELLENAKCLTEIKEEEEKN